MKENTFFKGIKKSFISFLIFVLIIGLFAKYIDNNPITTLAVYGILSIFYLIFNINYLKKCVKEFKFNKKTLIDILLYSALFIVLANFTSKTITYLIGVSPANNDIVTAQIKQYPILIIEAILLGPITEELIFRAPYQGIKKHKLLVFILYSSIFAFIHILQINTLIELVYFIPYLLLSIGIGFSFYKTDNVLLSIIVHIINNSLEIMLLFI